MEMLYNIFCAVWVLVGSLAGLLIAVFLTLCIAAAIKRAWEHD